MVGYVEREDLCGATCGEHIRAIDAPISDAASLADVVLGLAESPRLFVRVLGAVGGIITMSDLQKPPVRMWLFGMISLMEMRMTRLIELKCQGDSWKQYLSESRLQKAEALLEERKRRNQNLDLTRLPANLRQGTDHRPERGTPSPDQDAVPATGGAGRQDAGKPAEQSGPFPGHHLLRLGNHCRSVQGYGTGHHGTEEVQEVLGTAAPLDVSPPE